MFITDFEKNFRLVLYWATVNILSIMVLIVLYKRNLQNQIIERKTIEYNTGDRLVVALRFHEQKFSNY